MEETAAVNKIRKGLESRRKDANDPTLAVGDVVFCRGVYAEVLEITTHAPDTHPGSGIRRDWTAVQVRTDMGYSRWHGIAPTA